MDVSDIFFQVLEFEKTDILNLDYISLKYKERLSFFKVGLEEKNSDKLVNALCNSGSEINIFEGREDISTFLEEKLQIYLP